MYIIGLILHKDEVKSKDKTIRDEKKKKISKVIYSYICVHQGMNCDKPFLSQIFLV